MKNYPSSLQLTQLSKEIQACCQCSRLRKYCKKVAEVKRRAYLEDDYWGKPISGFGNPQAQLMIVGLAPAAHGANRTGRVFTGDRSGEWLYRALYKAGFAHQPQSLHRNDELTLLNAYITCVVKCAPPDNQPTPSEQEKCGHYLIRELEIMPQTRVWIALGEIAYKGIWRLLQPQANKRPPFQHGAKIPLDQDRWLLLSYHPSQQNTFTRRLTEPMFDSIFSMAKGILTEET